MKTTSPLTLREPGEGLRVSVVGDIYTFLATGKETNGRYALWEAVVYPGGGPPLHKHQWEEEGFYVLEGEITFVLGSERLVASQGTFVNMPVGTPHAFKNEGATPAKMLISVAPAGLEQMFLEIGKPLSPGESSVEPPSKEEIDKLLAAAPSYGIEILLP